MSAADIMRKSLEGGGNSSPAPSSNPEPESEPEAAANPVATLAIVPAVAPVNEPKFSVSSILPRMSDTQISPTPAALNNIFGLQSPIPSMATQASRLTLTSRSSAPSTLGGPKARSPITAGEPTAWSPAHTTGASSRPSLVVTMHVNAANVPAHLKAMPSQTNPNGSAPTPAPGPPAAASRAPSAAPTPSAMPVEAAEHGAPTRVYMNTKVTYHLLAGMKELAKQKLVLRPCV